MDFEKAKSRLIAHAVGYNDYENLNSWSELADKAAYEAQEASAKTQILHDIATFAQNYVEGQDSRDCACAELGSQCDVCDDEF